MAGVDQSLLASILESAMAQPIGLLLRCSDPIAARAALYRARTKAGNPAMSQLQIRISPFPDGDLVVCKGPGAGSGARRLGVDLGDLDL